MGRGKFKGKPTGRRNFSTPEEIGNDASPAPVPLPFRPVCEWNLISSLELATGFASEPRRLLDLMSPARAAGTSGRPRTFKKKHKGTEGIIQIENPNLVKAKNIKAKEVDLGKTTELSRREREELEKQKAHERYMKLQEQGKTEQARKDLGENSFALYDTLLAGIEEVAIDNNLKRLALIRQQRADAAKKREEEKAAKEQRKSEARK
ncbi:hypothetical protein C2845_PM07G23290 [Panicum miliaceum]|uniref:Casein kinase substrate phosphoprotein PP28 domain-containing protein n=1 Tax=Panicum miliaceum TaxID=4540 RepID=A0A3L6SSI5_PANMI|nr:hypothetical protein C2845_PM07G23290 [Panicum miliaceum]